MAYTTIDDPAQYFNIKLYTGNATNPTTISGIGFQPDWVWTKGRSAAEGHRLCDSVRGATKDLLSNTTAAESTNTIGLKSFNSDGYVIGNSNGYNFNSATFVSWNWLAGGSASSNTDGSITSTVSANATAGFSIVSYSGNDTQETVGHNLGVAPSMIIIKRRNVSANWCVYHKSIGAEKYLELSTTIAQADSNSTFNDTEPTSSVFSIYDAGLTGATGSNYIAYCFAEKKGYSKFGKYTGNGQASGGGPFIYLGFKPAFFLLKESSNADNWIILDDKRQGFNGRNDMLFPNLNNVEYASDRVELMSNGVKIIDNDGSINTNDATYIYMAFAENPFVANDSGTAVPVTAR